MISFIYLLIKIVFLNYAALNIITEQTVFSRWPSFTRSVSFKTVLLRDIIIILRQFYDWTVGLVSYIDIAYY